VNAAFVISGSWFILAIPLGDFEAAEDPGDTEGAGAGLASSCPRKDDCMSLCRDAANGKPRYGSIS
jgi:hypothetical protein